MYKNPSLCRSGLLMCQSVCSFPVSSSGLLLSFLYSSLQCWQTCCCSAHLIIINTDPPLPTKTHTFQQTAVSQHDHTPLCVLLLLFYSVLHTLLLLHTQASYPHLKCTHFISHNTIKQAWISPENVQSCQ